MLYEHFSHLNNIQSQFVWISHVLLYYIHTWNLVSQQVEELSLTIYDSSPHASLDTLTYLAE